MRTKVTRVTAKCPKDCPYRGDNCVLEVATREAEALAKQLREKCSRYRRSVRRKGQR